jgi:NADH-quinone oxidoreductase subunit A
MMAAARSPRRTRMTSRGHGMGPILSIAIFLGFGLAFVALNLLFGKLVRPSLPTTDKLAIYECGEPTIGSSWVQFDLRFYIVALFYLVFDVEVALIYPWAVSFREFPGPAVVLGFPFLAIVVLGYAYEWYSGSLDWVRSSINTSARPAPGRTDMAALARRDPEALEEAPTV